MASQARRERRNNKKNHGSARSYTFKTSIIPNLKDDKDQLFDGITNLRISHNNTENK